MSWIIGKGITYLVDYCLNYGNQNDLMQTSKCLAAWLLSLFHSFQLLLFKVKPRTLNTPNERWWWRSFRWLGGCFCGQWRVGPSDELFWWIEFYVMMNKVLLGFFLSLCIKILTNKTFTLTNSVQCFSQFSLPFPKFESSS